ncbi:MAG: GNAT family N-acetyltransferase [Candidatus Hermodarchaeia archaeon]|jgi:diamine N-acetyltransferase
MKIKNVEDIQTINLQEITRDNVKQVMDLKVKPEQEKFIASNARSIAEGSTRKDAWYRAIYHNDKLVGFCMISDIPKKVEYYLWRFMIDQQYQRMGYGRQAMEILVEHVKTRPKAKVFYTSCKKGKEGPEDFYLKMGFRHTGKEANGEYLLKMDL